MSENGKKEESVQGVGKRTGDKVGERAGDGRDKVWVITNVLQRKWQWIGERVGEKKERSGNERREG